MIGGVWHATLRRKISGGGAPWRADGFLRRRRRNKNVGGGGVARRRTALVVSQNIGRETRASSYIS